MCHLVMSVTAQMKVCTRSLKYELGVLEGSKSKPLTDDVNELNYELGTQETAHPYLLFICGFISLVSLKLEIFM